MCGCVIRSIFRQQHKGLPYNHSSSFQAHAKVTFVERPKARSGTGPKQNSGLSRLAVGENSLHWSKRANRHTCPFNNAYVVSMPTASSHRCEPNKTLTDDSRWTTYHFWRFALVFEERRSKSGPKLSISSFEFAHTPTRTRSSGATLIPV